LPPVWWRETLLALPCHGLSSGSRSVRHLRLSFVGPDVPHGAANHSAAFKDDLPTAAAAGAENGSSVSEGGLLVTRDYHRTHLHDFLRRSLYQAQSSVASGDPASRIGEDKSSDGDGKGQGSNPTLLWLSNPGLGHPACRASWAPTLNYLLGGGDNDYADQSSALGPKTDGFPSAAVLVTSHSTHDQARDVAAIQRAYERSNFQTADCRQRPHCAEGEMWVLKPERNRHRSRRGVVDSSIDKAIGEVAQANWGAFAFGLE